MMVSHEEPEAAISRAQTEVDARVARYRGGRPLDLTGRTVIVVDDGLATDGTATAAVRAVRAQDPARLILAVPVGARTTGLLSQRVHDRPRPRTRATQVLIAVDAIGEVAGDLCVPEPAVGLVVFAHGSRSSRHSPRNREVATALNARGLATLLLDLLTVAEALERTNVFDIQLLAERLVTATKWAFTQPSLARLPVGYFGASTGAGAALWAAAELGDRIGAVVSRGGRRDLAWESLADVHAPVPLIVGGNDEVVIELNRDAQRRLSAYSELSIVPGATHLFEEPGTLDEVSRLAGV